MPEADDGGGLLHDYRSTVVDLGGLRDFAQAIDDDIERNFRPYAGHLAAVYSLGVGFGTGIPSDDVRRARVRYADALSGVTEQMRALIEASRVLTETVRTVAENYADGDRLAALRMHEVDKALDVAAAAARAAARVADDEPPARRYQ